MFEIPSSTALIKDALGPRRLSQLSKIWCVLIRWSMESNLSTLWAQWLSLKGHQTLCKVCWSTVILLSQRYCHCVQFDEKWAFIGKGEAFHGLLYFITRVQLRDLDGHTIRPLCTKNGHANAGNPSLETPKSGFFLIFRLYGLDFIPS